MRQVCPLAHLCLALAVCIPAARAIEGFDPHGTGPRYPTSANGELTDKPALPAHRIANGAITIDGRLDEGDWIAAPAAIGFTQFEPDRRGDPCEETVFKVIYDDDAIYFGVACLRLNGEPITSCLSRRDNITSSDRIRIYIDPYHDLTTGYHFRINPHGVKEDYYNYGDLYHDGSWDAVWVADTYRDEEGWYAEIRIPFSSVRYRAAESMTWGFNVFQYIHSRGQRTAWSNWDRDQNGFMSRSGAITGITGIRPPRQLEIAPYLVGSTTDPSDPTAHGYYEEDWRNFGNVGADVKYGVTADLTLNATIQPDFGQIEADPSELNRSPDETIFGEKRPFFIEGAQFFWHPDFTVFYSRRIGTGNQNSRIRYAGKLTGKMTGDISTALLVAATDETNEGQAHNAFKDGRKEALYAISRFGKQFHDGLYSFNVMQTAVLRDEATFAYDTRNGYVTGSDFELNFKDRAYQVTGSYVGSIIDPRPTLATPECDPKPRYGSGSRFEIKKASGDWRWALTTRVHSKKLDLNDFGYLSDPDHYAVQAWVTRVYNADDETALISRASAHLRWYKSWIYADRTFADPNNRDAELWSYDRGHRLREPLHFEADLGTRNCWGFWCGGNVSPEGTDQRVTRWAPDYSYRGPLMTKPKNYDAWVGFNTDSRKNSTLNMGLNWNQDGEGSCGISSFCSLNWIQNSRMNHELSASTSKQHRDAQWVQNIENPGGGIGNVSYIFGELDERVWDLTLRSSMLFNRDKSLELYVQPFLVVGDFSNPRELATPDSYDLRPYPAYDITSRDDVYGSVNVNMVYRWEYRPGSTLFLVWAHTRNSYVQRRFLDDPTEFTNEFSSAPLFDNEPENRYMIKVSYWFPI